jgi:hypothetical protein
VYVIWVQPRSELAQQTERSLQRPDSANGCRVDAANRTQSEAKCFAVRIGCNDSPEIAHVHAPFGLAPSACAGRISEDRAPAWIRTNPRGAPDERTRNVAGVGKAIAASLSGTKCSRLFAFTSLASMRICLRLSRVTSSRLWRLVLPATGVLDEVVGPSGSEPRAADCSAPSLQR